MINFTEKLQDRFKKWVCNSEKYSYDDFRQCPSGMLMIGDYYVCKLPKIWHLVLVQDWLRDDFKIAVDVYSELSSKSESGFKFSADMMIQDHEVGSIHISDFFDTHYEAFLNVINKAIVHIEKNGLS